MIFKWIKKNRCFQFCVVCLNLWYVMWINGPCHCRYTECRTYSVKVYVCYKGVKMCFCAINWYIRHRKLEVSHIFILIWIVLFTPRKSKRRSTQGLIHMDYVIFHENSIKAALWWWFDKKYLTKIIKHIIHGNAKKHLFTNSHLWQIP